MSQRSEYFVLIAGETRGPFSGSQLKLQVESGELGSADFVRKNNGRWIPVSQVRGLREFAPNLTVGASKPQGEDNHVRTDQLEANDQHLQPRAGFFSRNIFSETNVADVKQAIVDCRAVLEPQIRSFGRQARNAAGIAATLLTRATTHAATNAKKGLSDFRRSRRLEVAKSSLVGFYGTNKRSLALVIVVPLFLICFGLATYLFTAPARWDEVISSSDHLNGQMPSASLVVDDPFHESYSKRQELADVAPDGQLESPDTPAANESTKKSTAEKSVYRWNFDKWNSKTKQPSDESKVARQQEAERQQLALAERQREIEAEAWARRFYLEQQSQAYRIRQFELEQQMRQSQEQAQQYYYQAQQQAEYEAQRAMRQYESQMSGRMGAMGIRW